MGNLSHDYRTYCDCCDCYTPEGLTSIDGFGYCEQCLQDYTSVCHLCGVRHDSAEMRCAYNEGSLVTVCEECWNKCIRCPECSNRFIGAEHFVSVRKSDGSSKSVCIGCWNMRYRNHVH